MYTNNTDQMMEQSITDFKNSFQGPPGAPGPQGVPGPTGTAVSNMISHWLMFMYMSKYSKQHVFSLVHVPVQ